MRRRVNRHLEAGAAFCALLFGAAGIGIAGEEGSRRAPDPTGRGEFAVDTAQYRLAATTDPTIMTDRVTEIWARVWRPRTEELERLPLVVFLHGNHATCGTFTCAASECGQFLDLPDGPRIDDRIDYTLNGTCPRQGEGNPPARSDYVVTPNHEGYTYLAEQLASRGYLVVSINANRGITAGAAQDARDRGLNLARGRLVLKHLELLSRWNRGMDPTPSSLGFSLQGAIDFGRVALVGHSRGGEGVRAAYNLYTGRNADFNPYDTINWRSLIPDRVDIKGIFEIAPVDRQTGRTLNAEGTTWSVMLPGCDGDVINQQGMWPYDRMMKSFSEAPARQKAFYYVLGANHNYWNTEWQFSDSSGCFDPSVQLFVTDPVTGVLPGVTGSEQQRTTGSASVLALIRGALRGEEEESSARFLRNFDPQYQLPSVVTSVARIQRGFIASPSSTVTTALEDFEQPTGTSQFGVSNDASNVTMEHVAVIEHGIPFLTRDEHGTVVPLPPFLHAGKVSWQSAGGDVYFQINFAAAGSGIDLSPYATLDFRVERESPRRTNLNPSATTNFHVQLVGADGALSGAVAIGDFIELAGPFGTPDADLTPPPTLPDGYHLNLQTARIPMGAFRLEELRQIRGIRVTFDSTATGSVYVTNFRGSRQGISSSEGGGAVARPEEILEAGGAGNSTRLIEEGNEIEAAELITASRPDAPRANAGMLRLTVSTQTPVFVRNELLTLSIGSTQCDGSYVDSSTQHMVFECSAEELTWLGEGEPMILRGNGSTRWSFGAFSSALLK